MNAIKCDYCGKFAANPAPQAARIGRYPTILPATWWSVGAWKGSTSDGAAASEDVDQGEFCSRECMSDHFAKPWPA